MYLGTSADHAAVATLDASLDRQVPVGDTTDETPDGSTGTIVALGLTSFFTDISSEMVAAILPLYLTTRIGFGVDQFGLFDGIFAASTVLLLLVGGFFSDRWQRPKGLAVGGYALSTASRAGLLLAASPILFLISDRLGKGLRSAPRDALISLHAPKNRLAAAFGVHRAFDTAGALLGPFLAWGLLRWLPGDYDTIFLVSLVAGCAGVLTIAVGVPGRERSALRPDTSSMAPLPRRGPLRRLSVTAALLGVGTISDGLLYLALFRAWDFGASLFPLLFAGTALVYLVLAVPFGLLADRVGKARLLVPAQMLLLGAYALVFFGRGSGDWVVWAVLAAHGTYYAMTDGMYPALAASVTDESQRGRGIGVVKFGNAMGRLVAAALFGLVWSVSSLGAALATFMVVLVACTALAAIALRPLRGAV